MLDSGASQLDAESVGIASNIFTGEATSIATEAGVLAIEGGLEAGMEGAILAGGAALAPETLGLSLVVAGVTAAAFIAINAFEHNDQVLHFWLVQSTHLVLLQCKIIVFYTLTNQV